MKILQVYNRYRSLLGGEEAVVRSTENLLTRRGHDCSLLLKSSRELDRSILGKAKAFLSGIYNPSAYREMARCLRENRPDIVHAHNLYPLFSPSVLVACRRAGVPVVMSSHNYMLTCPIVEHLHKGHVCEKCLGGHEYWCVLQNCRGNLAESLAYAARSITARKLRLFRDNVTLHVVLSDFAKQRLLTVGFDEEQIVVLPNMVAAQEPLAQSKGQYAVYSGRMSREKGVEVLLAAAAQLPDIPFRLAGDGPVFESLAGRAPDNTTFLGRLSPSDMPAFYQAGRFLVVPSMWFEGCPLVVTEAMIRGLPVIASRIGGLPELIADGVNGFLFTPGNSNELAQKIRSLWENPDLCRRMGAAAQKKASSAYGEDAYYQHLMAVYERAITLCSAERASTN